MKNLSLPLILLFGLTFPLAAQETAKTEAIRAVFQQDADLSNTRNHASETAPIAEAVKTYLAGLDAIDYSATPEEFAAAFKKHRDAWEAGLPFLAKFEALRGEMHALLDQVRAQGGETQVELERFEKGLFDSWGEIEAAARAHGFVP
jgi:hypothetical protein